MPGFQIVMRTPCFFHEHCDETAIGLLHRSSKDGQPSDKEWDKMCWVCEGVTGKIRETVMATGEWTCPVCGFVHTCDVANRGPLTPPLSTWYRALEAVG